MLQSCWWDSKDTPRSGTAKIEAITSNTAQIQGFIYHDGGKKVSECGICISLNPNPTLKDDCLNGPLQGSFVISFSDLLEGTKYYASVYAINDNGVAYGEQLEFFTSITDNEGNNYRIVEIENRLWTAENLRSTELSNGRRIKLFQNEKDSIAMYWYEHNQDQKWMFGGYYSRQLILKNNICPLGWRIPNLSDLESLVQLNDDRHAVRAKLLSKEKGSFSNADLNQNDLGFSAVGSGRAYYEKRYPEIRFNHVEYAAYFWGMSDDSVAKVLMLNRSDAAVWDLPNQSEWLLPCRCVKE